jgi:serine/threonine protein kinase
MISFPCPHCGELARLGDELAGERVECPACGQPIAIPTTSDLAAATTAAHKRSPVVASDPDGEALGGETVTAAPGTAAAGAPTELTAFLSAPQAPDEIGRLGTYRVLAILGHGGMGVVFRAEDPALKRLVALKAMLPSRADSDDNRRRFLREAQAAAAIKDDHVVSIFQVGEDRSVPFVAMELLEGEPLDRRLQRGPKLSMAEIVRIGRETALGLAAAHDKGLIHRDIKPGNLWLESRGGRGAATARVRVKVLDFGLARACNDDLHLTQSGAIVGTPAYMSPEQADGRSVDQRSDLFSLGCVLYQLCTGELAFQGSSRLALLSALALATPRPPRELNADVPPALSDLVMQLLAKKPEQRPASAEVVAAALQDIEADTGAGTPGQATRSEAGKASSTAPMPAARASLSGSGRTRHPLVWLAGGSVACLGVMGLLAFLWLRPGDTALLAEQQVKEVTAELQRHNAGFDGDVKHWVEGGVIRELEFSADHITDLSPLRVLTGLRVLVCCGSDYGKGQLADLSPLQDMKLTKLNCRFTKVNDLSSLQDMKLTELDCRFTKVRDLSPLQGMKLQALDCSGTEVSDLRPLTEMPLRSLDVGVTKVSELSPLKKMPLRTLKFPLTPVTDLSPLTGIPLEELEFHGTFPADVAPLRSMPLKSVRCDFKPDRDAEILRSIKTLQQINDKPAAEFWKEADAKKGKP